MAKIEFKGLDVYVQHLSRLDNQADKYIGKAIYDGADIVADSIKSAINALPTDDSYKKEGLKNGPTSIQKAGLVHSFGIAKLRREGSELNVKIGFDGYNRVISKRWPQGQPNAMVARSIESGTSFMKKNSFVSKGTRTAKPLAEAKMKETIEKEIEILMK